MEGKRRDVAAYEERITIMVVKAMVREIARLLEALGSKDTYTVHIETTKLDGKMVTLTRVTKNIKF